MYVDSSYVQEWGDVDILINVLIIIYLKGFESLRRSPQVRVEWGDYMLHLIRKI